MDNVLPMFRADVNVEVHREDSDSYLVLHDPFGFADGPIMVHADMVDILERCDGNTTWAQLAEDANVEYNGEEIMRARAFVGQLNAMGYFETDVAEHKRREVVAYWQNDLQRQPACAGSVYPDTEVELINFMRTLCAREHTSFNHPQDADLSVECIILIPHIDFRVSADAYAYAAAALENVKADVFVVVGTSHYWSEDLIVPTAKHFATPIGVVHTDQTLVRDFLKRMEARGFALPSTDIAHKPEHSLELPAVLLQYLHQGSSVNWMPLLVCNTVPSGNGSDYERVAAAAEVLRASVRSSGKRVCWIVSGDMSHYGLRFGSDRPATEHHESVARTDAHLIQLLTSGNIQLFHETIESTGNATNVCGHLPLVLTLLAAEANRGELLYHTVWNDTPTGSAVSFGVMQFANS